jgi:hypothetical protein
MPPTCLTASVHRVTIPVLMDDTAAIVLGNEGSVERLPWWPILTGVLLLLCATATRLRRPAG